MLKNALKSLQNPLYLLAWLGLSLYLARFHEPFADEAQSYLIARDVPLSGLFADIARQEGSPMLWVLWLKFLLLFGFSYTHIAWASILPEFAGTVLFVFKAPFSRTVKYLFPLTYYIFFQYNLIARNYSLLFLCITLAAVCYSRRQTHPLLYTGVLMLLGSVSAHALILSCGLFALWGMEQVREKHFYPVTLWSFGAFILFSLWLLWPEASNLYIRHYTFGPLYFLLNFFHVISVGLVNSYFMRPENLPFVYMGILYFAFMAYYLYKLNRLWFIFLLLPNILFMVVVPYKPWHTGMIILAAMFIFWQHSISTTAQPLFLRLLLALFFAVQLSWSCFAFVKEKGAAYSAASEVYGFLQKEGIKPGQVWLASFNTVALRPYFNLPQYSYWNWRERGFVHAIPQDKLLKYRSIVVNEELHTAFKKRLEELKRLGGYQERYFRGNQFFALEDMSECESYYLYYRGEEE